MALPDELGDLMRSHDHEAPRAADLPARPWARTGAPVVSRRREVLLPLAAVAAVLVIVAGAVTLARVRTGGSTAAAPARITSFGPPVTCPHRYVGLNGERTAPWVPAKPRGIDTGGRLVPNVAPVTAVVCTYSATPNYRGAPPAHQRTSERIIESGLDEIRTALAWLPPVPTGSCAGTGVRTDDEAALLGLRYRHGAMVWVSATGHDCSYSSNGDIQTDGLFAPIAQAYESGAWPTTSTPTGH